MGSSFEEFVARDPMVKTDRNSDTRIKSYGFLKKNLMKLNARVEGLRACGIISFLN